MNEKQKIEKATAEGFLALYNVRFGTDFRFEYLADPPEPDVHCTNSKGQPLNLEITATEDRTGDIKALLGRSDSRSIEALEAHLERVQQGKEQPMFSSLSDEVSDNLVKRIQAKLQNSYGLVVALVVRDASGVDWDWHFVVPALRARLNLSQTTFDRGVWIISRTMDRLFQII